MSEKVDKIKYIRKRTGKPLTECESALKKTHGDEIKAIKYLKGSPSNEEAYHKGYQYDLWVVELGDAIVRNVLKAASEHEKTIRTILIDQHDMSLWPMFVFATLNDGTEVEVPFYSGWDHSQFLIPDTFDEEDYIFDNFEYQHLTSSSLDTHKFSNCSWFKMPNNLWRYALIELEDHVKENIIRSGKALTDTFTVVLMTSGEHVAEDREMLLSLIEEKVKTCFTDDADLQRFTEMCYATTAKRKWFIDFK